MPTFDLDKKYSATFITYLGYPGFIAKGSICITATGKPIKIFDAYGKTMSATEKAARKRAHEIYKTIVKAKPESKAVVARPRRNKSNR
jgi:hypothetical protein